MNFEFERSQRFTKMCIAGRERIFDNHSHLPVISEHPFASTRQSQLNLISCQGERTDAQAVRLSTSHYPFGSYTAIDYLYLQTATNDVLPDLKDIHDHAERSSLYRNKLLTRLCTLNYLPSLRKQGILGQEAVIPCRTRMDLSARILKNNSERLM